MFPSDTSQLPRQKVDVDLSQIDSADYLVVDYLYGYPELAASREQLVAT